MPAAAEFYPLRVARVDPLTADAAAITFSVPDRLAGQFGDGSGVRVGDRLLKAHVTADRVAVVAEQGTGEQAGHPPVAVLERVDDEKVEEEQAG